MSRCGFYEKSRFLAFAVAREFVPQHVYLMYTTKFLENRSQVILVQVLWHLTHEHFYVVGIGFFHPVVVHHSETKETEYLLVF